MFRLLSLISGYFKIFKKRRCDAKSMRIRLEELLKKIFASKGDKRLAELIIDELMNWEEVIKDPNREITISSYCRRLSLTRVPEELKPTPYVPRGLVEVAKIRYVSTIRKEPYLTIEQNAINVVECYKGKEEVLKTIYELWRKLYKEDTETIEYLEKHDNDYQSLFLKMRADKDQSIKPVKKPKENQKQHR